MSAPIAAQSGRVVPATMPVADRFGIMIGASSTMNSGLNLVSPEGNGLSSFYMSPGTSRRSAGVDAALYARIWLNEYLSIQPELHYTRKGGRNTTQLYYRYEDRYLSSDGSIPTANGTLNLAGETRIDYAEVPMLVRAESRALVRGVRVMLLAGPSVALRLSCRNTLSTNDNLSTGTCQLSQEVFVDGDARTVQRDAYQRFDATGIIGAGVSVPRASHVFTAQLRYTRSLIPVTRIRLTDAGPRTHGVSLLLGVGR